MCEVTFRTCVIVDLFNTSLLAASRSLPAKNRTNLSLYSTLYVKLVGIFVQVSYRTFAAVKTGDLFIII
jgi:hypothetical protein